MHRLLLQIQLRVLFHILKQFPDFGEHQDNSWMKGRNDSQTSRLFADKFLLFLKLKRIEIKIETHGVSKVNGPKVAKFLDR